MSEVGKFTRSHYTFVVIPYACLDSFGDGRCALDCARNCPDDYCQNCPDPQHRDCFFHLYQPFRNS